MMPWWPVYDALSPTSLPRGAQPASGRAAGPQRLRVRGSRPCQRSRGPRRACPKRVRRGTRSARPGPRLYLGRMAARRRRSRRPSAARLPASSTSSSVPATSSWHTVAASASSSCAPAARADVWRAGGRAAEGPGAPRAAGRAPHRKPGHVGRRSELPQGRHVGGEALRGERIECGHARAAQQLQQAAADRAQHRARCALERRSRQRVVRRAQRALRRAPDGFSTSTGHAGSAESHACRQGPQPHAGGGPADTGIAGRPFLRRSTTQQAGGPARSTKQSLSKPV